MLRTPSLFALPQLPPQPRLLRLRCLVAADGPARRATREGELRVRVRVRVMVGVIVRAEGEGEGEGGGRG